MTATPSFAVDWFDHSVTVEPGHRREVSETLSAYFDDLRRTVGPGGGIDVHATGSLGRGEPSIRVDSDRARLASDLDLVVVGSRAEVADAAAGIRDAMNQAWPELDSTTFAVVREEVPDLQSMVAVDLAHRWALPVVGTPGQEPTFQRTAHLRDHFEVAAHQLGGWLFYPTDDSERLVLAHFRDSRATHELKAALELVRLGAALHGMVVHRYGDLVKVPAAAIGARMSRGDIDALVRRRETGDAQMPEVDITGMARAALERFVRATPGAGGLGPALVDASTGLSDLLDVFPMLMFVLVVAQDSPRRDDLVDALGVLLGKIDDGSSAGATPALHTLRSAPEVALGGSTGAHHPAWVALREVYYDRLGDKNFGRLPSRSLRRVPS